MRASVTVVIKSGEQWCEIGKGSRACSKKKEPAYIRETDLTKEFGQVKGDRLSISLLQWSFS